MKPILFSTEMVRAILDGRKTQTRRVVKPQPSAGLRHSNFVKSGVEDGHGRKINVPYYPGDILWVIQIKPIEFGKGKYGVGDDGCVYDISGASPKKRKTYIHNGYEQINLRYKGEQRGFRINRLVCEAFYGHPLDLERARQADARHLDGNRLNNLPENLDWGTRHQNVMDTVATGILNGESNGSAKLSQGDVEQIRQSNEKQYDLAARYGVNQSTISRIKNQKRWGNNLPSAPPANIERWCSRLFLRVTGVRVERLQDISEDDARAEGVQVIGCPEYWMEFAALWDSFYTKRDYDWDTNPWVEVIEFERYTP